MSLHGSNRMGRAASSLLAFVMLLSITVGTLGNLSVAQAVSTSEETVSTRLDGPDSTAAGEKFTVNYTLHNAVDVMAQRITLRYEADAFGYVSVEASSGLIICAILESADGKVDVVLASNSADNAVNGSKLCLTFTFKAMTVKASLFELKTAQVANSNGVVTDAVLSSYAINTTDRSELRNKIAEAQNVLSSAVEGTTVGTYPDGMKARLQAAIDAAIVVKDSASAVQNEIDTATTTLTTALNTFESLKITNDTGNFNSKDGIDIGDLALVANCFGIAAGDAGWEAASNFDINGDGRIGVYEMAFIAIKILG